MTLSLRAKAALLAALLAPLPAAAGDIRLSTVPLVGSLTGTETLPVILNDNLTMRRASISQLVALTSWNQWKGAWSGATNYIVNDVVSSGGSSYIAIAPSLNQSPPNATYWAVVASKGSDGAGTGTVTSVTCGTGLTGGAITTTGTCALDSPVSVAHGGTGATSGSGTALDNISGFASTGFIKRTGTGIYTFIADPLPVANGGTGLSSGTSGGVPCYTSASVLASSGALSANNLVVGGGAGACPTFVSSLGSTTTLLHGNAAGPPSFSAVVYSDLDSALVASTTDVRTNAGSKVPSVASLWAAGEVVALTDAATIAVDLSTGINFSVTLAGNRTLGNPTNTKVGQSGVIRVSQDATGSRTLAYGSNFKWSVGTPCVLSTAASKIDYLFYFVFSSTEILLSCTLDVR